MASARMAPAKGTASWKIVRVTLNARVDRLGDESSGLPETDPVRVNTVAAAEVAMLKGSDESPMSWQFFPRDEYFMRLALREASRALEHDDVPIGAVVVRNGEVIGLGHNERELRADPTAHAELIALREAARTVESWRILDSVLYVTLEPCAMCAGAIVLARVPRVVFAARDPKAGAAGSVLNVLAVEQLNHRPRVEDGLLAEESADILRSFFAAKRR
jgi:tRNA(adenine34) deaminase